EHHAYILGEAPESDLPVAALEGGESQAEEHVAGAVEGFAAPRLDGAAGGIADTRGRFAEPGGFGGHDEGPVGMMGEPVGQPGAVTAHQGEMGRVRSL